MILDCNWHRGRQVNDDDAKVACVATPVVPARSTKQAYCKGFCSRLVCRSTLLLNPVRILYGPRRIPPEPTVVTTPETVKLVYRVPELVDVARVDRDHCAFNPLIRPGNMNVASVDVQSRVSVHSVIAGSKAVSPAINGQAFIRVEGIIRSINVKGSAINTEVDGGFDAFGRGVFINPGVAAAA